jgi:hypothetical protein
MNIEVFRSPTTAGARLEGRVELKQRADTVPVP